MRVRDAELPDLPEVVAIWNEELHVTTATWTDVPQTLEERVKGWEERAARGFPTLVAEEDGTVLGMATYGDFRDSVRREGYRYTVEHSVHVRKSAWGRGVGRALMEALLDRARAAGIHAMIGGIDGSNAGSIAFHLGLGFREVGRLPETGWKHGRWCDLVFVEKLL